MIKSVLFPRIPSLLAIPLISLSWTSLKAQSNYFFTQFDGPMDPLSWTIYRNGSTDPSYVWGIQGAESFSPPNSLEHLYPVGGTEKQSDYYITGPLDFEFGGQIDSLAHHFSGFGVPAADDTLGLYLILGSANPAQATHMIELIRFTGANYNNDGQWRKSYAINIPAVSSGTPVYLAFKYATVNNWLDVRFDDLYITRYQGMQISEEPVAESNDDALVVESELVLPSPQKGHYEIYELNGSLVSKGLLDYKQSIDLSGIKEGHYILRVGAQRIRFYKKDY